MNTSRSSAGAFTLVEIMIVAAIIGLLAALAVPAFNKVRQVARNKSITNNLRQIAAAAQQYILENGVISVNETQLAGTDTTYYLRPVETVNGEDYSTINVNNTSTQIEISDKDADTITYNI